MARLTDQVLSASTAVPQPPYLNISAYKFIALDELVALRARLAARAGEHDLKGTILLAHEGINLFLAGEARQVHAFLRWLKADERFADLDAKESWSDGVPFKRLLVKIKHEIIRMNCPTVRPQAARAPSVSPDVLARWLDSGHDDEGRQVVMLDTRNAFEVDVGGFDGALNWHIDKFSEFPGAFVEHLDELEGKTVVSYCTGGIRCEKAALLMRERMNEQATHANAVKVLQLEGGILRYLESQMGKPGARHYKGECFVFDERRALDAGLAAQPSAVDNMPRQSTGTSVALQQQETQ